MPLRLLGSVTGIALVIAGILYLVGILVTCADLWHAGMSIRDTIPLLSLEQLLTRGVSLAIPALTLLTVAALGMAVYWALEKRLQDRVRLRLDGLAACVPESIRERWLADAAEANDKTDWDRLRELLRTPYEGAPAAEQSEITRLQQRASLANVPGVLLFVMLLGVILIVPPVFAVAAVVTAGLWMRLGARPLSHYLAVGYAVLALAFLADLRLDPRDLPRATIATDEDGMVHGRFLFLKDGEWFVATSSRMLRVIETEDVRWARIERGESRRSLIERLGAW